MSELAKEYQSLIEKRKKIEYIVEWETEPIIQEMIKLLTRNIDETIKYLKTECTADEIFWMSEIFDELVETTQSKLLIDVLQETIDKYPTKDREYHLSEMLNIAKMFIKE